MQHKHLHVYKMCRHTYTLLPSHLQCEGNKVDKQTNYVCKENKLLQGRVDITKLLSFFLVKKYTQTHSMTIYTNAHTHIHYPYPCVHTLSPPTLCKSLATVSINLDETTQWQGEAFIPFPKGGVMHSRGSREGQIKLSKEAGVIKYVLKNTIDELQQSHWSRERATATCTTSWLSGRIQWHIDIDAMLWYDTGYHLGFWLF